VEIAERIGKAAFNFSLIFSIIVTVVGIGLLASGVNPGDKVTAMFMPLDWVYQRTIEVQQSLPQNYTEITIFNAVSMVSLFGIFLEFLFMLIFGFLVLVHTISTLLPQQLAWLSVPLYFLGAFIQLMSWIYILTLILDRLSQLVPFLNLKK